MAQKRRSIGGVGARKAKRKAKRRLVGVGAQDTPPDLAAATAATVHDDLIWNNGPVITTLDIFPMFFGTTWSDALHQAQSIRLVQFLNDLLASDYINILTQYGVGTGGQVHPATFVTSTPANVTDAQIQTIIQNTINGGTLPEPPPSNTTQVLVIFLDESVAVNDNTFGVVMCEPKNDNAFGYHSGFVTAAGNNCYYAIMPALDDACITNSCPDGGCSVNLGQTQEQRRTQVASHEIAEMATDPSFSTGWFGQSSDEIGDICNGQSVEITIGPNTWTVQAMYSKTDDINTNGGNFCLAGAPSPIPLLPGGPPAANS